MNPPIRRRSIPIDREKGGIAPRNVGGGTETTNAPLGTDEKKRLKTRRGEPSTDVVRLVVIDTQPGEEHHERWKQGKSWQGSTHVVWKDDPARRTFPSWTAHEPRATFRRWVARLADDRGEHGIHPRATYHHHVSTTTTRRSRHASSADPTFPIRRVCGFQTTESPRGSRPVRPVRLCIFNTTDAPVAPPGIRKVHTRGPPISHENGSAHVADPSRAPVARKIGQADGTCGCTACGSRRWMSFGAETRRKVWSTWWNVPEAVQQRRCGCERCLGLTGASIVGDRNVTKASWSPFHLDTSTERRGSDGATHSNDAFGSVDLVASVRGCEAARIARTAEASPPSTCVLTHVDAMRLVASLREAVPTSVRRSFRTVTTHNRPSNRPQPLGIHPGSGPPGPFSCERRNSPIRRGFPFGTFQCPPFVRSILGAPSDEGRIECPPFSGSSRSVDRQAQATSVVVGMAMDAFEASTRRFESMLGRGLVVAMGTTLAVVLMVVLGTTSSDVWTKRAATLWPENTMENVRIHDAPNHRSGRGRGQTIENVGVSKGPYLEHENFKVLLRNTEPKTGTTALEWTFQALFREACAEFWRSSDAKSGNCSLDQDKGNRTYSMDLNGSKIVFSAMHKHYLEFQGFVYPMGPIVGLVKACMDMGLSGWSSSCAEFAEAGIPAFQPKEEEQLLYMNIYRDPIAAATSWVKYSAEKELGHEELNARVLDICDGVAARIGLRARIAWKILPEKGYSVYSYAYESTVGDQEKWAADLLRAIGLHMSADSVRKALDSVSPTSMKHLLEDAKKGLVEDLPAGLEVSGTNSRKVGMATSKGYRTLLTNATVASCRRASLKHLPLAMALKYQLG